MRVATCLRRQALLCRQAVELLVNVVAVQSARRMRGRRLGRRRALAAAAAGVGRQLARLSLHQLVISQILPLLAPPPLLRLLRRLLLLVVLCSCRHIKPGAACAVGSVCAWQRRVGRRSLAVGFGAAPRSSRATGRAAARRLVRAGLASGRRLACRLCRVAGAALVLRPLGQRLHGALAGAAQEKRGGKGAGRTQAHGRRRHREKKKCG